MVGYIKKKKLLYHAHVVAEDLKRQERSIAKQEKEVDLIIENILNSKFTVRGIHAKVYDYSIRQNYITFLPAPPSSGRDELTLTFEEFADQVDFI